MYSMSKDKHAAVTLALLLGGKASICGETFQRNWTILSTRYQASRFSLSGRSLLNHLLFWENLCSPCYFPTSLLSVPFVPAVGGKPSQIASHLSKAPEGIESKSSHSVLKGMET